MTKIEKALKYARAQLSRVSPYVWGGQGEKVTKMTVTKLAAMEDSPRNAGRVMEFIKRNIKGITSKSKCYDCSGYVLACLAYGGIVSKSYDATADTIMKKFTPISRAARKAGDLVFKVDKNGKAYHVGILLTPDDVAEARGRDYGVVKTPFNDDWQEIRRPLL